MVNFMCILLQSKIKLLNSAKYIVIIIVSYFGIFAVLFLLSVIFAGSHSQCPVSSVLFLFNCLVVIVPEK